MRLLARCATSRAERNAELEELARTDVLTRAGQPPRHARRGAPPDDRVRAAATGCELCADAGRHRQLQGGQRRPRPRRPATRSCAPSRAGWPRGCGTRTLASRWGGEEFLLLLPDATDAVVVCERLRAAIADSLGAVADGLSVVVTASCGWVVVEPRGDRRRARGARRRCALRGQDRRARPRGRRLGRRFPVLSRRSQAPVRHPARPRRWRTASVRPARSPSPSTRSARVDVSPAAGAAPRAWRGTSRRRRRARVVGDSSSALCDSTRRAASHVVQHRAWLAQPLPTRVAIGRRQHLLLEPLEAEPFAESRRTPAPRPRRRARWPAPRR